MLYLLFLPTAVDIIIRLLGLPLFVLLITYTQEVCCEDGSIKENYEDVLKKFNRKKKDLIINTVSQLCIMYDNAKLAPAVS